MFKAGKGRFKNEFGDIVLLHKGEKMAQPGGGSKYGIFAACILSVPDSGTGVGI